MNLSVAGGIRRRGAARPNRAADRQHIARSSAGGDEPSDAEAPPNEDVPEAAAPDVPVSPAPPPAYHAHAWLTVVLWSVVAFLLGVLNANARLLFPFLPPDRSTAATALAVGYLALLLVALLFAARSAARLPHKADVLLSVGLTLAIPFVGVLLLARLGVRVAPLVAIAANNLFLPAAAALVGAGVGRVIRHPNTLLAAAGFSIFFDIVMVTMGTVAILLKNNSQAILTASVGGGVASLPNPALPLPPPPLSSVTIGPADVLFLALFLSAIALLRLSERATLAWMFGLLAAALALVEVKAWSVPALAPMGVAVILANARHAAFTPREKRDLLIGVAFALVLAVFLVAGARGVLGGGPGR